MPPTELNQTVGIDLSGADGEQTFGRTSIRIIYQVDNENTDMVKILGPNFSFR